uniref:Uncharacterized protein n=1 Tax=Sinocyclocheilus anshuiensis TaxID=1608454 RepID=A0A671LJF3_9TELE
MVKLEQKGVTGTDVDLVSHKACSTVVSQCELLVQSEWDTSASQYHINTLLTRMPPPRGKRERTPPARGKRERTPPPRGKRERTPPPRGKRERTPPARGKRERTPPPRGKRERTPPPRGKRERTPPPREDLKRVPPPRRDHQRAPPLREGQKRAPPPRREPQQALTPREPCERTTPLAPTSPGIPAHCVSARDAPRTGGRYWVRQTRPLTPRGLLLRGNCERAPPPRGKRARALPHMHTQTCKETKSNYPPPHLTHMVPIPFIPPCAIRAQFPGKRLFN